METTIIKHCCKCNTDKPEIQFARDRSKPDGRFAHCRACQKEYNANPATRARIVNWMRAHPERRRVYNHRYYATELGRLFRNQGSQRHQKLNTVKTRARRLAYRNRHLLMKACCEHCGSKDKLHRHHPNYDFPYIIVTLCEPCHLREHGKIPHDTLLISFTSFGMGNL